MNSYATETSAVIAQKSLFAKELKKGYIDIDSPSYRGSVNRGSDGVRQALEPEDGSLPITKPVIERCIDCGHPLVKDKDGNFVCASCLEKEKKNTSPEEDTVFCVSNLGIEDRFDLNVEYVAERHIDTAMVWVYDKLGRKDAYFKTRFLYPSEMPRNQLNHFWTPFVVHVLKNREKTCDGCKHF
jgi:hypothetical protein